MLILTIVRMPLRHQDTKIARRKFLATGLGLIVGLFTLSSLKSTNQKKEDEAEPSFASEKNKKKKKIMKKKIISTTNAPSAIGPYSQAILVNGFLYTSGQICINPATNELVMTNIQDETHQVMKNLKAILTEAGMGFENVIKTTIFLQSMNDFQAVNEVYASYFSSDFPARETVEVAKLPKAANVEISMIAVEG